MARTATVKQEVIRATNLITVNILHVEVEAESKLELRPTRTSW